VYYFNIDNTQNKNLNADTYLRYDADEDRLRGLRSKFNFLSAEIRVNPRNPRFKYINFI